MSMSTNKEFWSGKKVFLTGHTGFKGAWLCMWLNSLGARVTGFSVDIPSNPSLFEIAGLGDVVNSVMGDIQNLDQLRSAMKDAQPDIVLHLAAQSLVRKSYKHPVETFSVNVMGTVNVLEAIRQTPSVKAAVMVTSDKCYENREWHWGYRESEAMGGHDTYSASKGCSELVAAAYRRSFFTSDTDGEGQCAIASARAGNVIGGGDWAEDRLVPDILAGLAKGQEIEIRNPHAVRPWQHVLEPLSGYLKLAEKLFEVGSRYAEGWNFGPNDDGARTVSWVVNEMVEKWASGSWFISGDEQPHEATYLKLDNSKALAELAWQPVWSPSEALDVTVNWHKKWIDDGDMAVESMKDIEQYVSDGAIEA